MGEIEQNSILSILLSAYNKLKSYENAINTLTTDSKIVLIILLSQYLYALYCDKCKLTNGRYYIYPRDVASILTETKFSQLSSDVINLRNMICHSYNSGRMEYLWQQVFSDTDLLNDFLKYILSQADLKITLLKMNGGL